MTQIISVLILIPTVVLIFISTLILGRPQYTENKKKIEPLLKSEIQKIVTNSKLSGKFSNPSTNINYKCSEFCSAYIGEAHLYFFAKLNTDILSFDNNLTETIIENNYQFCGRAFHDWELNNELMETQSIINGNEYDISVNVTYKAPRDSETYDELSKILNEEVNGYIMENLKDYEKYPISLRISLDTMSKGSAKCYSNFRLDNVPSTFSNPLGVP